MAEEYTKGSGTGRGGWRGGGRPTGTTKTPTVVFYRRVTIEEKEYLEKCLEEFRNKNKD